MLDHLGGVHPRETIKKSDTLGSLMGKLAKHVQMKISFLWFFTLMQKFKARDIKQVPTRVQGPT